MPYNEPTSTKALNLDRRTVGIEGATSNDYFQLDYFQPDYFQTGTLIISGNTMSETVDLNLNRRTIRLLD